jgi:F0F1-type ATP synthase epsilon subunit
MKLVIFSAESKVEHDIAWIEANTPDGNFVIQSEHASVVLILSAKKECIYCFTTGKQESFIPENGGLLRVTKDLITVLLYC